MLSNFQADVSLEPETHTTHKKERKKEKREERQKERERE
jgi:hypothetical protein